jgi:hypothetical protein
MELGAAGDQRMLTLTYGHGEHTLACIVSPPDAFTPSKPCRRLPRPDERLADRVSKHFTIASEQYAEVIFWLTRKRSRHSLAEAKTCDGLLTPRLLEWGQRLFIASLAFDGGHISCN